MLEIGYGRAFEIFGQTNTEFSGRNGVEFWASKRLKFLGEAIKNFWQAAKQKDRLFKKNCKTAYNQF